MFELGHRYCPEGERFGVLGNCEQLGNWNPAKAVPMKVGCVRWPLMASELQWVHCA